MSSLSLALGLGFGLALSVPLSAQETEKTVPDAGIKAQLTELGYKYELDDDNDFKLVFEVGDEGRSQIVYVLSAVESYGKHSVREVWSPAYESPTEDFPGPVANRLLEASNSAKLGAWVKQGKNATFVVKIPSDASKEELDDAIDAAIKLADEMENELTPGQDDL
jgi:putative sensory transduction regulator